MEPQEDDRLLEGELGRLAELGAHDPAGPAIAAMAEAHRRAGEPAKALELADAGLEAQPQLVAARVARALALLDLGRGEAARAELEAVLDVVADHPLARGATGLPPDFPHSRPAPGAGALDEIGEAELEDAFRVAEPETDQMVSPNDFAEAAVLAVDDEFDATAPAEGSPYETATVAALLDEQGHRREAAMLRGRLEAASGRGDSGAPGRDPEPGRLEPARDPVLSTLERWLDHLRRRTG